jgi:hypothetical protein
MPDPGKFVHRVFIYNPTQIDSPKGDKINNFNDSAPPANGWEIRASIEPLVGRELVVAKGIRGDITLKLRSWYTTRIGPLTRFYWYNGTKWLRIEVASPISPDFQNRELWFYGCVTNL